jgi:hypothetical protein
VRLGMIGELFFESVRVDTNLGDVGDDDGDDERSDNGDPASGEPGARGALRTPGTGSGDTRSGAGEGEGTAWPAAAAAAARYRSTWLTRGCHILR